VQSLSFPVDNQGEYSALHYNLIPSVLEQEGIEPDMSGLPAGALGALGVAMGGVILALGIFLFVVAYGLLKGMGWAWTLTVVLSIISIALNAISLATGNPGGHNHQRGRPLLPVQAKRKGVFRQGSGPDSLAEKVL
jgi:hypothetical protein